MSRELRIKSAEKVFNAIVEHTQDLLDRDMYMSFSTLNESAYGEIVTACANEIMRKLDISPSCDECFSVLIEYISDASEGFDCKFSDMCVALIEGR